MNRPSNIAFRSVWLSVIVATCMSLSPIRGFNDKCDPATITPNTNPSATPLTGCLCVVTGRGTIAHLANCAGCTFNIDASARCSYSSGPSTDHPIVSTWSTTCGGVGEAGIACPCTGKRWYMFDLSCGACSAQ